MTASASVRPVALTCGEPAGIGPELAALAAKRLGNEVPFFWIGDPRHLPSDCVIEMIAAPQDALDVPAGTLAVLRHDFPETRTPGTANYANAQGVIDVIARAVDLVLSGDAAALCTAPIHKKVLKDGAHFAFPGHTEYLAHLAGVERVVMMLASSELRVVPATIHIALDEVAAALTPELLSETIDITAQSLRDIYGLDRPRIAVAGLNPHAGEGGAMGQQELTWMNRLIADKQADGLDIRGPLPADTMFHARARAGYDVAVCAYHDQALIPIKTIDFDGGVNVTLGLPFFRSSPDHGTAFDIAGKGIAKPDSLIAALRMAHEVGNRPQKDQ